MVEALQNNSCLMTLDLSNNYGIDNAAATNIAEALRKNSTLTTLKLAHNRIGNDGAAAIAAALKSGSALTTLDLQRTYIGQDSAAALAQAMKHNPILCTLDLSNMASVREMYPYLALNTVNRNLKKVQIPVVFQAINEKQVIHKELKLDRSEAAAVNASLICWILRYAFSIGAVKSQAG
jgi:Leucine Rich repeat